MSEEAKPAIRTATPDDTYATVSYTHLRAHETVLDLVCRLLLEKKKKKTTHNTQHTHNTHNKRQIKQTYKVKYKYTHTNQSTDDEKPSKQKLSTQYNTERQ